LISGAVPLLAWQNKHKKALAACKGFFALLDPSKKSALYDLSKGLFFAKAWLAAQMPKRKPALWNMPS
jgi:hypothetical protein